MDASQIPEAYDIFHDYPVLKGLLLAIPNHLFEGIIDNVEDFQIAQPLVELEMKPEKWESMPLPDLFPEIEMGTKELESLLVPLPHPLSPHPLPPDPSLPDPLSPPLPPHPLSSHPSSSPLSLHPLSNAKTNLSTNARKRTLPERFRMKKNCKLCF